MGFISPWGSLAPLKHPLDEHPLELLREGARHERALLQGTLLLSAYTLPATSEKLWIISDWDRSITSLLLPSEY